MIEFLYKWWGEAFLICITIKLVWIYAEVKASNNVEKTKNGK